jgi:hypothetical protein
MSRGLLGYDALKMLAAWPSETLVFHHVTARCLKPEDDDMNLRRRENVKSHNVNMVCCVLFT